MPTKTIDTSTTTTEKVTKVAKLAAKKPASGARLQVQQTNHHERQSDRSRQPRDRGIARQGENNRQVLGAGYTVKASDGARSRFAEEHAGGRYRYRVLYTELLRAA